MRSWNKRGEDDAHSDGMSSLVKIIIVALFLVFFFAVGSKLYAAVFGVDKNTMDSFNGMLDNFELMLQRPTNFEYLITTFISNDQAVIKAQMCGKTPCICIYKNQEKLNASNPWKCRNFDDKTLAVASGVKNYNDIKFYSLRAKIMSESNACDFSADESSTEAQQLFAKDDSSTPKEFPSELYPLRYYPFQFPFKWCGEGSVYFLYIEKYVYDKKAFLSLGENLKQETIDQRIDTLSDCPFDSDEKCRGVRRNSVLIGSPGGFCYYNQNTKVCEYMESFKECERDQLVTDTCLCGTQMIFKNSEYKYCAYRVPPINSHYALPFNCDKIIKCSDYCKTRTSDASCDNDEMEYCKRNICDDLQTQACDTLTQGDKVSCVKFKGEPNTISSR